MKALPRCSANSKSIQSIVRKRAIPAFPFRWVLASKTISDDFLKPFCRLVLRPILRCRHRYSGSPPFWRLAVGGHWKPAAAASSSLKGGKTVNVYRLPIIGKNRQPVQPFWRQGGNFCRPYGSGQLYGAQIIDRRRAAS